MFTRQHCEAIAGIVKTHTDCLIKTYSLNRDRNPWTPLTDELADYFAKDNPRFNRERFLVACGL